MLQVTGERIDKPLVVRLDGNNAARGRRILAGAALAGVHNADTMDDAARIAAEFAGRGAC
jgi:succinyl-CoA synthetase beta subunit